MIVYLMKEYLEYVTPFAGVWIEILAPRRVKLRSSVTPFAGVWIEIMLLFWFFTTFVSLPSRECGLK